MGEDLDIRHDLVGGLQHHCPLHAAHRLLACMPARTHALPFPAPTCPQSSDDDAYQQGTTVVQNQPHDEV